jgi:hypothetical protein
VVQVQTVGGNFTDAETLPPYSERVTVGIQIGYRLDGGRTEFEFR